MPSFNRVTLIGNVTRDPQLKFTSSQTAITEFGMAMNRKFKVNGEDREEVCFVDCTAFGKAAEIINQYITKGAPLFVEGRLKLDSWEDKQGGKRSKLTVVVENFQFLGGRQESDGRDRAERPPLGQRPPQKPVAEPDLSESSFDVSEIPF